MELKKDVNTLKQVPEKFNRKIGTAH